MSSSAGYVPPVPSGRELLGVALGALDDLGAALTAGGVDDRDDISRLVIPDASSARTLLPGGAVGVALDLPFAMEHGPGGRLVEGVAVLTPVDHALARLPTRRGRGGLQIGGVAGEKGFDFSTGHIDGEGRSDQT